MTESNSPSKSATSGNEFGSSVAELARRLESGELAVEEAMRAWGDRTVWAALLHIGVKAEYLASVHGNHPAKVFLSYRWEGDEHVEWVVSLAEQLRHSGYEVLLDRWNFVERSVDVPKFVARMAACDVVLMVVTHGYMDAVRGVEKPDGSIYDGWVFDEFRLMKELQTVGRIEVVGLLRSGNSRPGICTRFIDVSTTAGTDHIAGAIGYSRQALSEAKKSRLGELVDSARRPPHSTLPAALREMQADPELEATPEFAVLAARYLALTGRHSEARGLCEEAVARSRDIRTVLDAAEVMNAAGSGGRALRMLMPFAHHGVAAAQTHFIMGNILDDMDSLIASRNHFRYGTVLTDDEPNQWLDLGYVAFRGGDVAEAELSLRKALQLEPSSRRAYENLYLLFLAQGASSEARAVAEQATQQLGDFPSEAPAAIIDERRGWLRARRLAATMHARCSVCTGSYPDTEGMLVCGDCGTVYSPSAQGLVPSCPCCSNNGFTPMALGATSSAGTAVECPICHEGTLRP
jgi:tetratricopeptide (TPR) repeat protein